MVVFQLELQRKNESRRLESYQKQKQKTKAKAKGHIPSKVMKQYLLKTNQPSQVCPFYLLLSL